MEPQNSTASAPTTSSEPTTPSVSAATPIADDGDIEAPEPTTQSNIPESPPHTPVVEASTAPTTSSEPTTQSNISESPPHLTLLEAVSSKPKPEEYSTPSPESTTLPIEVEEKLRKGMAANEAAVERKRKFDEDEDDNNNTDEFKRLKLEIVAEKQELKEEIVAAEHISSVSSPGSTSDGSYVASSSTFDDDGAASAAGSPDKHGSVSSSPPVASSASGSPDKHDSVASSSPVSASSGSPDKHTNEKEYEYVDHLDEKDKTGNYHSQNETEEIINETLPFCPYNGITNIGSTCYISCSLQMFFSVPKFFEDLKAIQGVINNAELSVDNPLMLAVLELKKNLDECDGKLMAKYTSNPQKNHNKPGVNPKKIRDIIAAKYPRLDGYGEMDNEEFSVAFLETLDEEIGKCIEKMFDGPAEEVQKFRITSVYYNAIIGIGLKCGECAHIFTPKPDISSLVTVGMSQKPNATVQDCVDEFFEDEEVDDLLCQSCGKRAKTTKSTHLSNTPRTFVVHLKRYYYNTAGDPPRMVINRKPIMASPSISVKTNTGQIQYNLRSITYHDGDENEDKDTILSLTDLKKLKVAELREVIDYNGLEIVGTKDKLIKLLKSSMAVGIEIKQDQPNKGHYTIDALRGQEWIYFDDAESDTASLDQIIGNHQSKWNANTFMLLYVHDGY